MAKFAETANKAAKSLSTTTTDYTKASLIYFELTIAFFAFYYMLQAYFYYSYFGAVYGY